MASFVDLKSGQDTSRTAREHVMSASEIIFEVTEDEVDGGYSASALGYGIHTQGDSVGRDPAEGERGLRLLFR